MLPRYAADTGRRVMPPLLGQEKALVDRIIRPLLPFRRAEAPVLRQRLDAARRRLGIRDCAPEEIPVPDTFARRLVDQLEALPRRRKQMNRPIEICRAESAGDRPAVKRARPARSERSMISDMAVDEKESRSQGSTAKSPAPLPSRDGATALGRCGRRRAEARLPYFATRGLGRSSCRRPRQGSACARVLPDVDQSWFITLTDRAALILSHISGSQRGSCPESKSRRLFSQFLHGNLYDNVYRLRRTAVPDRRPPRSPPGPRAEGSRCNADRASR